ncbi:MAG: recombinase family protein [Planctomycetota bacterium]
MAKETGCVHRAAGYVRVSQERAAQNGFGLDAQEADVRRHADYRRWQMFDIYRENGVSGYRRERPSLERLLADAKCGKFDVVVFPSIDRVGRSVKDVIEIEAVLRGCGVGVIFVREGIDTSTPTGELFRNIMASISQFEGRLIAERLSKGRCAKKSQGGYVGGRIPYGYRNEGGALVNVQEEAAAVKQIFQWKAAGKSLRKIVGLLNAGDTKPRRGGAWSDSTVWNILKNRFYTGRAEFEGEWIPAQHEAIVSDKLFRKCSS